MAGTQPERPMILGNCISCNGLMRVPVTTDVSHVARCPHCDARFPVQQLIASAIPAAEIIEGEVAEDLIPAVDRVREEVDESSKTRDKFEVPKQLHDGAKFRRRRRRRSRGSDERKEQAIRERGGSSSSRPSTSSRPRIDAATVPVASTESMVAAESAGVEVIDQVRSSSSRGESSRSSGSSRSSRRESSSRRSSSREPEEEATSPFIEWLKIGIGGMIAFPTAYLAMMWILGLDPFGLATQVNKVAPFLVPAAMAEDEILPLAPVVEEFDLDFDDDPLPTPSIDPDEVRG